MLPRVRDAEARRLPLELARPRRVSRRSRASAAPRLHDRHGLRRRPGDEDGARPDAALRRQPVQRRAARQLRRDACSPISKAVFTATTGADGVASRTGRRRSNPDDLIAVARCGEQTAATDPGAYLLQSSARDLLGYIYTDKPIYRPGHAVHVKACCAGASATRDAVRSAAGRAVDRRSRRQGAARQQLKRRRVRRRQDRRSPCRRPRALGYYTIRVTSGDENANGSFEVQEYRKPEFDVLGARRRERFVVQGRKAQATIRARYYFGQPVARGAVTYVLYKSSYYSPLRWSDESGEEQPGRATSTPASRLARRRCGSTIRAKRRLALDVPEDETAATTRSASRRASPMPAAARSPARARVVGTYGEFLVATSSIATSIAPGRAPSCACARVDYHGSAARRRARRGALERITGRAATAASARSRRSSQGERVQTDAEGRASWKATIPGDERQLSHARHRAVGRPQIEDDRASWIPGADEDGTTASPSGISSWWPTAARTRPATPRGC